MGLNNDLFVDGKCEVSMSMIEDWVKMFIPNIDNYKCFIFDKNIYHLVKKYDIEKELIAKRKSNPELWDTELYSRKNKRRI